MKLSLDFKILVSGLLFYYLSLAFYIYFVDIPPYPVMLLVAVLVGLLSAEYKHYLLRRK